MKHYKKTVINPYNNKQEVKILNACEEIPLELEEVDFVFVKKNGVYEGTDSCKYPFKVIHYELGIPCRFHDFRDTHATKLIESNADIKSVSKRLGHRSIDFTYYIYVRVTEKMEKETADKFKTICKFCKIDTIKLSKNIVILCELWYNFIRSILKMPTKHLRKNIRRKQG